MAVKLWWAKDYSAMRWPCPEGFHIPTNTELVNLFSILTASFNLWANSSTPITYLKMPASWNRMYASSSVGNAWNYGSYWSCVASNAYSAYYVSFGPSSISSAGSLTKASWFPIRPFKDVAVVPDTSWTTLYDWSSVATWAGVYHNSSLWLISVSWDWTTWYTISDKNLWATTVYNSWNTLSEANCGYFYQRGNNYWFPFAWTVTNSSTKVNASNYWPWNYYSSSTFITVNTQTADWSSVQNGNLRWWVTWIRPWELKAAYIGEFLVHPVSQTFTYTWSDQTWTVPYTQDYIITAKWAWSRKAVWWLWQWTFSLTAWDVLSIMVWANWGNWNTAKYWFGGTANWWSNAAWWWMSWVFTWSWTILATDSARALVIWWWAGGSSAGTWWAWWWETWATWTWSYGTAWAWWTQTWHWSWWNAWTNQFDWWNGSGTYWYWGWWGWRWWNGSRWDSSSDDDKWGWGWSGYVLSTATNRVLTQWWWAAAWNNWEVTIISVSQ